MWESRRPPFFIAPRKDLFSYGGLFCVILIADNGACADDYLFGCIYTCGLNFIPIDSKCNKSIL
jgi:hypothetical protein